MTSRQFRRALGRGQGKVGKIDCRCGLRSQRGGTKSSSTLHAYASPTIALPSAMLFFPRSRIYVRRDRGVQTRFTYTLQVKRTFASNAPTFKYRDSYETTPFGRLRRARNSKTLLRNRSSEHNRAAEVHAPFGRPSPRPVRVGRTRHQCRREQQMLEGVRIMMSRTQARAAFTRHGFIASD
jgi:hypothetical protein